MGAVQCRLEGAHHEPVNRVFPFAGFMLASGDDEGTVCIWDMRAGRSVMAFPSGSKKNHLTDFISGFAFRGEASTPTLVASCGDGSIGVIDLRAARVAHRSDPIEDEHMSICVIKGGRKVVTGTQDGILCIFTWDHWADLDDRFPHLPKCVERLIAVDDHSVLAGFEDGTVRLLQIQPNRIVATIGDQGDEPVVSMALSADRRFVATAGQDTRVRFWDCAFIAEGRVPIPAAHEVRESEAAAAADSQSRKERAAAAGAATPSDDDDDDEDDDENDDDDDMDDDDMDDDDDDNDDDGKFVSDVAARAAKRGDRRDDFFSDM